MPKKPATPRTVQMILTRIEVGAPRNGRPGYRWTTGYYVVDPKTSQRIYPPVIRREAYALARQVGGENCRVELRDDATDAKSLHTA